MMGAMATRRTSLDVVIVSYGAPELLHACLRSLRAFPLSDGAMQVHVVDNASPVDVLTDVRRAFPEVICHQQTANLGFSVANNVVLKTTQADFVLVLNPDTEVREHTLDALVRRLRERPDVGMVGCRLVQPDGTFDHAAKRSFPTPAAALAHFTGLGRRLTSARLSQYRATELGEDEVGEVDAVNGAFMLVTREALARVGPLDEGYWLYMEDLDWCARFWEAGSKVLYDGTQSALHVKGGSAGTYRAVRPTVHFHRGMGRFYRRHQAGANPALDAAVYVGIGAKLAVTLARNVVGRELLRRRRAG